MGFGGAKVGKKASKFNFYPLLGLFRDIAKNHLLTEGEWRLFAEKAPEAA